MVVCELKPRDSLHVSVCVYINSKAKQWGDEKPTYITYIQEDISSLIMMSIITVLVIVSLLFLFKLEVCVGVLQQEQQHQQQQEDDEVVVVCKEEERRALLDFKQGLKDPYGLLSSWTGNNCCSGWKGVRCSTRNGHVVRLDLHSQEPLRDIFDNVLHSEQLGGEIRPSLLGLRHLRYLDVSFNYFGGIRIPAFIGSLQSLRYLNLSYTGLYGTVPHQLGHLTNLLYLDLSGDDYSPWKLHVVGSHWLSNLTSLEYLNLDFVDLSKAPNMLHSLNTLPRISLIHLFQCNLHLPLSLPHVNFTSLYSLDISDNNVNSAVPMWLFELSGLQYLYMGDNHFSNLLPPVISNLTNLKTLDLSFNHVGFRVPKTLGDLCMLSALGLSGNNVSTELSEFGGTFSGCINKSLEALAWMDAGLIGHLPGWLENLKSLKILDLSYNSLYGPIPELQLPSMRELVLSTNALNGTLPENLGHLFPELVVLSLSNNKLAGVVTETHFANLANLEYLDLGSNAFKFNISSNWVPPSRLDIIIIDGCQLGPGFPAWVQKLENLSTIYITNGGISDIMPDWFWNFSPKLQKVDLSQNDIKGKLPRSLEHLNLTFLDMSHNHFEGSMPIFPPTIKSLLIKNNSFSGIIPDCWNKSLQIEAYRIDLSYNNLSGYFPGSICGDSLLEALHLNNNNLSGELPQLLTNCQFLRILDLSDNKFNGNISTLTWDRLLNLEALRLRSNLFTGNIPPQLGGLKFLQHIDLAHNHFSGEIPTSFGNLKAMKGSLNSSQEIKFYDEIKVETKGRELWYEADVYTLPTSIDFSHNELIGEIPKELTSLIGLRSLHLSANHLTGKIPESISELRLLESLDLSVNNLSGTIPESMTLLTSLSDLNLSYNELSGKIPSGGQFQTFINSSIYSHNYHLCGFPLDFKCYQNGPTHESPILPTGKKNVFEDNEKRWSYLSVGLGFASGLWAFCGALIINKRWCFIYFQLLDDVSDWIYIIMVVNFNKIKRSCSLGKK